MKDEPKVVGKLRARISSVTELTAEIRDEMFALMAKNYDAVNRERFHADLVEKDEVILLEDENRALWGFSTLLWNPKNWREEVDVIFSGDTIIAREAWGSQALVRAFCKRAGQWKKERGRTLFWLLISKGHRTYLYLPLFAREFHPAPKSHHPILQNWLEKMAPAFFGDDWDGGDLLVFLESRGQLAKALAADSNERLHNEYVRFFLEKNPRHAQGEELLCLAELSVENLKRGARLAFLEGLEGA